MKTIKKALGLAFYKHPTLGFLFAGVDGFFGVLDYPEIFDTPVETIDIEELTVIDTACIYFVYHDQEHDVYVTDESHIVPVLELFNKYRNAKIVIDPKEYQRLLGLE